jgi:hypothetical protein
VVAPAACKPAVALAAEPPGSTARGFRPSAAADPSVQPEPATNRRSADRARSAGPRPDAEPATPAARRQRSAVASVAAPNTAGRPQSPAGAAAAMAQPPVLTATLEPSVAAPAASSALALSLPAPSAQPPRCSGWEGAPPPGSARSSFPLTAVPVPTRPNPFALRPPRLRVCGDLPESVITLRTTHPAAVQVVALVVAATRRAIGRRN